MVIIYFPLCLKCAKRIQGIYSIIIHITIYPHNAIKTYICSHDTFLGLKIVKNGYCGNDGFIFAWDLGVIFLRHTKF